MIENRVGRFDRRLGDDANQVVDAQVAIDGLVEAAHALDCDTLAAGVRIDDQRIAAGDHAHGVAGDRGQRVRDRRNRADDAERSMLDDGQAMVAAYATIRLNKAGTDYVAEAMVRHQEIYGQAVVRLLDEAKLRKPTINLLDEDTWPEI